MKIIEYTVVISGYGESEGIEEQVAKMIDLGWQPLGGIALATQLGGDGVSAQAMVKYDETTYESTMVTEPIVTLDKS